MSRDALPPPDPAGWLVQHLRLIAFPTEPQHNVQQNWWRELTGFERDTCVQKKLERDENGVFEGASLSLSIDMLRLQWTAAPHVVPGNIPEEVPNLGKFVDRVDWFAELMHRWFAASPPINRLAFATLLIRPVEDIQSGCEILNRFLRNVDLDSESTDFRYRINWPVKSQTGVPDLRINRLTTWALSQFAIVVQAQPSAPEGLISGGRTDQSEFYACALEMDINTVPIPAGQALAREALPRIFDELVQHGRDIAKKGDSVR